MLIPRNEPSVPRNQPSIPRNEPSAPRNGSSVPWTAPSIPRNAPLAPRNAPSIQRNEPPAPRSGSSAPWSDLRLPRRVPQRPPLRVTPPLPCHNLPLALSIFPYYAALIACFRPHLRFLTCSTAAESCRFLVLLIKGRAKPAGVRGAPVWVKIGDPVYSSNRLTPQQKFWTAGQIVEKLTILASGFANRGKSREAARYRRMIRDWSCQLE